ncbi:MAG: ATP-binding protein [Deltaproteobacteria bacterium]|nr:ATP-binding protein [Deltaproteobacteria bacterium]
MRCNLRCKFLLLFLAVMVVALSAAVMLRGFIINDFKSYLDGESQDRIQRLIAQLEGSYDTHGTWKREALTVDLTWALQMGVEARVFDNIDTRMLDTREAIELLTPLMRKRVLEVNGYEPESTSGEFTPYTLFLKGNEIGRLEARLLKPVKEEYFINSTSRFLAASLALLGILALVISLTASRRLAKPILELSDAAGDIAGGDLTRRVTIPGQDEIGKLSANFNRMAESLEAQEKLRGRLLSGAAHELRTPLAIISGELEGMIDGVLPTTREELQSMHNEATRLTSILNGLDELTRAESSVLNLRRELIELKPFLSAITGRFDRIFSEKNAVILLDCPDNLTLFADPDRLSQIIINLISNALKAIEAGGRVSIVATLENRNLRLEVTDNGTGISEENLPHVFERFYKGAGDGLGLGLAIVKELVAAHGGTVEAENHAQGGAKFILMFPVDR